jgi:hypothetical protein
VKKPDLCRGTNPWAARFVGAEVDVMVKRLSWALRLSATIGGAWMCAGCGAYSVTTTGGTVFEQSGTAPDPLAMALRASASRDLNCESGEIDVQRLELEREYAVTACGESALYRVVTPSLRSKRVELLSRSPSSPAGVVAGSRSPTQTASLQRPGS